MPAIGAEQPGDHIEDALLAGARRAEQRGEPRSGGEVRGDDPVAEAAGDVDINRHAAASRHACGGRAIRRGSARRARAQPRAARGASPPPRPPAPAAPSTAETRVATKGVSTCQSRRPTQTEKKNT